MPESCPNLKPMSDWIQEPNPNVCRPCTLGIVARWYRDELKAQGKVEEVAKLEKLADETNVDDPQSVLTFCQELDKIKASVGPLRERLEDFDCAVQSYDQQAAEEPEQQQIEK